MMAALLEEACRHIGLVARVWSAGTGSEGLAATPGAQRLLRDRGLDVSGHVSHRVDVADVDAASLILTAQAEHVVHISGQWRSAFARTFTLPELVDYAGRAGPRAGRSMSDWLAAIATHRPPAPAYLDRGVIPEIPDPTGASREVWEGTLARIDDLTTRLAEHLR
jgi:protein-tyrosine-phosphatase